MKNALPKFSRRRNPFLLRATALFVLFLLLIAETRAQNPVLKVFEDWNDTAGTQNSFIKTMVRSRGLSGTTYYYTCGATLNSSGNYDMFLQKRAAGGSVIWTETYDHNGGNDVATDVQTDGSGNVYICGAAFKDATDSTNGVIIKYNSSGSQQWLYEYNGSGSANDGFSTLALSSTAVFAVGSAYSGSSSTYDFLAVKVSTSSGTASWETEWDYSGMNDAATNLYKKTGTTALFVAGAGQTSTTDYDYVVVKIDPSSGVVTLNTTVTGSSVGFDQVTGVQQDANSNIYITGSVFDVTTLYDYKTVALDSELNVLWSATYDGGNNLNDNATGLYLDANGNVIVTGSSETPSEGRDYTTIKYDPSGNQVWVANYNNAIVNGNDSATAIVVDANDTDKIYVTGYSDNGSTKDYYTLRYDGGGNEVWEIGYNDHYNGEDRAFAVALDTVGGIVVTGQNKINDSTYFYTTVKYIEKNVTLPQDTIAATSSSFVYTENRGQLLNTNRVQIPQIKFYTMYSRPKIYFADTSLSYVFTKLDTSTSHSDTLTRVDLTFANANSDLRIRPVSLRSEISNYYLPRRGGAIEHVQDYDELVNFSVWNNVDMIYKSNLRGLKYYFICKPGGGSASYTNIDLKYNGADSLKVDGSGQLIIYTKLGNIIQPKAAAWELDGSGNFSSLGWQPSYHLTNGNEITFNNIGSYNTSHILVISVDWGHQTIQSNSGLEWSTYYGGDGRDRFTDVDVYQPDGSSFYAGEENSTYFPTTTNAIQTLNGGGWNAVAAKFDSTGVRKYVTLYGADTALSSGGAAILCRSGAIDANGNYVIAGHATYNSVQHIQFPITQPPGAYVDTTIANNTYGDGFFAQFNPSGALRWATYFGGTGTLDETVNDVGYDNHGNLYAVMNGNALTPHMVLAGAYNDSSTLYGEIVKFDSTLALKWATSFGTSVAGADPTERLTIDQYGTLYVTGQAVAGLPIVNPGGTTYMDSTFTGPLSDAYIARFDQVTDTLTWCTYLGGSGADFGWGMTTKGKDLYISGYTQSTDFPFKYSGLAYIDSVYDSGYDIFVSRFNGNGHMLWSTYYGQNGVEQVPTSLTHDTQGNIYLMGGTGGNAFPLFDPGVIFYETLPSQVSGYNDYIVSFNALNTRTWSTFFAGSNDEETANGIATYQNKKLYVCGTTATPNTAPTPFPTQQLAGAYWQPNLYSSTTSYNAFISRFAIDSLVIIANINEEEQQPNSIGSLFVYPNPSDGQFQILINSASKNKKIEVFNSIGQVIQEIKLDNDLTDQAVSLNLSEEANGIYLIVLVCDDGLCSKKLIKQ